MTAPVALPLDPRQGGAGPPGPPAAHSLAGTPMKVVSELLGHATYAFTADVYTSVSEELAESAASAIAAFVPRKGRASHQ